jgi:outer membrane protein assembly factor BamB
LRASHPSRVPRRSTTVAWFTCIVVLGMPLAALADWTQFQGGPTHEGVSDGPSAPLRVAWANDEIDVHDAAVTGGLSSPVVADDGTIVVVGPNQVIGFDGEDGSEMFSVERDLGLSAQPAIGDGPEGPIVVYAEGFGDRGPSPTTSPTASPSPSPSSRPSTSPADAARDEGFDSHVRAIDLRTGDLAWTSSIPLDDIVRTPIATDTTTAYVGDLGGDVTAIELSSGEIRWTADVGTAVAGAVTIEGDLALVATVGEPQQQTPGVVVALDRSTGDELWRSADDVVRGNLVSAPVAVDGRILVLEPGSVLALDAADRRLLWRTEILNPLTPYPFSPQGISSMAPVSADDMVFVVDVTGRVYGLDAETGAVRWDQALNDASSLTPPVLTAEHLLVPTNSGTLYAVDPATGHLLFRIDSGGSFLRGLAGGGDVLIGAIGGDDAGIVAFVEDPTGVLIDEPSPTTFDVGKLLAGFVLGALPIAIVALALARPLQRRLGPSPTSVLASEADQEAG